MSSAYSWSKGIIGAFVGLFVGLIIGGFVFAIFLVPAALLSFAFPAVGTVLFGGFILWEAAWMVFFFLLFSGKR